MWCLCVTLFVDDGFGVGWTLESKEVQVSEWALSQTGYFKEKSYGITGWGWGMLKKAHFQRPQVVIV
ncbi:hypothetical protein TNCT_167451 [Trichonephila clavata]|uniref:Uncharacterized protein n=1 Tax=Trichonephila clavata TaxID=2740835 RepID=A0A8X6H0J0_TRICU|nr:hypothetical protein TNCT_167451 [Trichonephila clavata]